MAKKLSITLLDGRTLPCFDNETQEQLVSNRIQLDTTGTYLRVGHSSVPHHTGTSVSTSPRTTDTPTPATVTDSTDAQTHKQLFYTYFHTFYAHRERILSDSRMFLARIPMYNGLAYTGTSGFHCPTLGVLIEWLLHTPSATWQDDAGRIWMVCSVTGSPLSGSNGCTLVDAEGNLYRQSIYPFMSLWRPFMHINGRYDEAKAHCQHYTLEEVVSIFAQEGLLQNDPKEITILHLNNQIAQLRNQLKLANERADKQIKNFHIALMRRHLEELRPMWEELEQQLSDGEKRIKQISALRTELRRRLRTKEITNCVFQQKIAPLNQEREKLEVFVCTKPTRPICDALFEREYISYDEIRSFFISLSQPERDRKLSAVLDSVRSYLQQNILAEKK